MCLRRFAACQGQSGRFDTHQSVSGVPALPEATSIHHVDAKALGVTHQSVWGVPGQPEATSVGQDFRLLFCTVVPLPIASGI